MILKQDAQFFCCCLAVFFFFYILSLSHTLVTRKMTSIETESCFVFCKLLGRPALLLLLFSPPQKKFDAFQGCHYPVAGLETRSAMGLEELGT